MLEKLKLVLFDQSNNNSATDVKLDGSVLEENSSFKMLGLTFCSKLDWGSDIISIAKTASKKNGAWIRSISLFQLRLLCTSINLTYAHAWNAVAQATKMDIQDCWSFTCHLS